MTVFSDVKPEAWIEISHPDPIGCRLLGMTAEWCARLALLQLLYKGIPYLDEEADTKSSDGNEYASMPPYFALQVRKYTKAWRMLRNHSHDAPLFNRRKLCFFNRLWAKPPVFRTTRGRRSVGCLSSMNNQVRFRITLWGSGCAVIKLESMLFLEIEISLSLCASPQVRWACRRRIEAVHVLQPGLVHSFLDWP